MSADETAGETIARLYADYAPSIVRHLERMTHDRETAEDLAQETFIKALRDPAQLASVENVRAWLFRVATHTAYDEFRRQRRRETTPLTDLHANTLLAEHSESTFAEAEPIRAALDRMPDHYRVPLLMQGYAGYPLGDIASVLGWKEGTVKSRLHRARAQFQQLYAAS
jgi:RNA polymerase sigma-70 factor (ECF subfamily)